MLCEAAEGVALVVYFFFFFLLLLEREQTTDMTERKHTIVLLRPNKNTRTYFEYDTVSAAMDGKERAAPTLEKARCGTRGWAIFCLGRARMELRPLSSVSKVS